MFFLLYNYLKINRNKAATIAQQTDNKFEVVDSKRQLPQMLLFLCGAYNLLINSRIIQFCNKSTKN